MNHGGAGGESTTSDLRFSSFLAAFVSKQKIMFIADFLPVIWPLEFMDLFMFLFWLVFVMPLCASVYMCFVVTCWERADLLALVCGVYL